MGLMFRLIKIILKTVEKFNSAIGLSIFSKLAGNINLNVVRLTVNNKT